MAVLAASGSYLPRVLTFGPTNGPEDFQELVFIIFGCRLYREHFLFLDDLAVATGRKACLAEGPSAKQALRPVATAKSSKKRKCSR